MHDRKSCSTSPMNSLLQAYYTRQVEVHFRVFPTGMDEGQTGVDELPESGILEFNEIVSGFENSTIETVPCTPSGFDQTCQLLLRDILQQPYPVIDIVFPQFRPVLGRTEIHCLAFCQVMPLSLRLEPWPLCPCHGEPLDEEISADGAAACAVNVDVTDVGEPPVMGIADVSCPISRAPLRRQDCK